MTYPIPTWNHSFR